MYALVYMLMTGAFDLNIGQLTVYFVNVLWKIRQKSVVLFYILFDF